MTRESDLADKYYTAQEKRLGAEPVTYGDEAVPVPIDDDVKPIDQFEAAQAVLQCNGNVTRAAGLLGVKPQRLRAFVNGSNVMKSAIAEALEQGADRAVEILFEGLRDEGSYQNRFYAAKAFLQSEMGRKRGFGQPQAVQLDVGRVSGGTPTLVLKWLEPLPLPAPDGKTIEGEKVE